MVVVYQQKSAPFAVYETIGDCNLAYPYARMPSKGEARGGVRSFTCAAAGLWDDLTVSGHKYTLDFLPDDIPVRGEPDRLGAVVATQWGHPPILLLAGRVPLHWAWEAITKAWPTTLDGAARVLHSISR
ncbi:hypothetical protein [Amycolatopsis regifaucium]|uniref:Uncharacterized protein n=1 Tax=Amycolatopsis regifaucium TaxID=546365 RepID=A0A154MVS9_9PSEU|nr:hypothetical protein [Amycolatopsis regifaucium]KZB88401.1 hypothetical protein AVL48_18550 [Amycolatopsis regifaucium]OKA04555.1 hypothetical protein ATP06_0231960 [Amycolatopsis regifaucium]SFH50832.1 hypothetical protein SAMN04489731_104533 [Amycolatopsis regifaucium]